MFVEEHNKVVLEFDLSDFSREDIDIDVKHNSVSISAKKGHEEKHDEGFKSFLKSSSSFNYESSLPEVKADEVKIEFERGVLKVEILKR